jgi:hypothetical protein
MLPWGWNGNGAQPIEKIGFWNGNGARCGGRGRFERRLKKWTVFDT